MDRRETPRRMRGAGRSGTGQKLAPLLKHRVSSNTPHPPLRGTFSHKGRRRRTPALRYGSGAFSAGKANRLAALALKRQPNLLLFERLALKAPSPLAGEGGSARSAETDERCWTEWDRAETGAPPEAPRFFQHPSSAPSGHLLPQGEKETRSLPSVVAPERSSLEKLTGLQPWRGSGSQAFASSKARRSRLLLPLREKVDRRAAPRRMRGVGRSGAGQKRAPLVKRRFSSNTPHPPLRGTFSHKARRHRRLAPSSSRPHPATLPAS